jgi:hypothetical protein
MALRRRTGLSDGRLESESEREPDVRRRSTEKRVRRKKNTTIA